MGFTKYTQEMFNLLPVVGHIKKCPSGNYSEIKEFPSLCQFGAKSFFRCDCKFGDNCSFEFSCDFADHCTFGDFCEFGAYCVFDNNCSFGHACNFGRACSFGEHVGFGSWSSFGEYCEFRNGSICEFGEFDKMISCGGFGSEERTTYFFLLTDKRIFVRCGCFHGNIDEWAMQVSDTHEGTNLEDAYLALIPAVKAQFEAN